MLPMKGILLAAAMATRATTKITAMCQNLKPMVFPPVQFKKGGRFRDKQGREAARFSYRSIHLMDFEICNSSF
jgi:hypothetical protein